MRIIHRGHELNQQQLNAILPVLQDSMNGRYRVKKKLEAAIDQALEAAGCPCQPGPVIRHLPLPPSCHLATDTLSPQHVREPK